MPYLILTVQRKNIYIRIRYIYIYTITQYIHYKKEGQNDEWYHIGGIRFNYTSKFKKSIILAVGDIYYR